MRKKNLAARFCGSAVLLAAAFVFALTACPSPSGGGDESLRYTLTFDSHGGSVVAAVTAEEGTKVDKPADPTKAGHTFIGWFSAETGGTACTWPHTLTASVTMHAQWRDDSQPAQYTITFDSQDGSAVAAITRDEGTAVDKPADPTKAGHTFIGWFSAETGGTLYAWPHTLTASITMHARWRNDSLPQYAIAYVLNGGTNHADNPDTYTGESAVALAAPERADYSFEGWYDNEAFTGNPVAEIPAGSAGDKTFYAKWTLLPGRHIIAFDSHGGSEVADIIAVEGTAVEKPANPEKSGYAFIDWFDGETGGAAYSWPYTPTAGVTMHARWTAITYTVVYEKNAAGASGTTASSSHAYDQAAALTANGFALAGYVFSGWNTVADGSGAGYGDGESVTNLASDQGAAISLYAQWLPTLSVSIAIWKNEDGDILVSGNDVTIFKTSDEPHSFTAEVKAPYTGAQWYLNGVPTGGSRGTGLSITINAKDYGVGTHILGVSVTGDGAPHSTQIHFTVAN